ncbi:MAG: helix-turn-helix domain-containing protein [Thermoanaerobaculia bacterium]
MPGAEKSQSRQPPWDGGADAEPIPFGGWLRRQRELRQVSLREIADVTKISIRYLEALEEDRFDVLPAPVFAKGFLREYARYVGLDPDDVVNTYLTAQGETQPEETAEPWATQNKRPSLEWTSGLLLALAVAVVLALVAVVAFYAERSREAPATVPAGVVTPQPPAGVTPGQASPRTATARAPLVVTMDFAEDCWVEATVDGQRRLSELHVQGESLMLEADQLVVLTLGNARAVRIEVNGTEYDMEVGSGRIARDVRIDLETARKLAGIADDR